MNKWERDFQELGAEYLYKIATGAADGIWGHPNEEQLTTMAREWFRLMESGEQTRAFELERDIHGLLHTSDDRV